MAGFFVELLVLIVGLAIGTTALLFGRRQLGLLLGAAGLYVVLLIATEFLGYDRLWDLVVEGEWLWVATAVALAVVGVFIGRTNESLAHMIIGFLVGVAVFLWLDEIILYASGRSPDDAPTEWWMIVLMIVAGLIGLGLTVRYSDTGMILYSSVVGTGLIMGALHLDPNRRIVAIITLSLLLLGVVVQFAQFLREQNAAGEPFSIPDAVPPPPNGR